MKSFSSRAIKKILKNQKFDPNSKVVSEIVLKELLLGITTDPRGWKNPLTL